MEFLNHYRLRITAAIAILVVVILYLFTPSSKPSISGFVKPTQPDVVVIKTNKTASNIVVKKLNTFFDSKKNAAGIVIVNYHDTNSCSLNVGQDTSEECKDYVHKLHSQLDNKAKLMASELQSKQGEAVVKTLKGYCNPPPKGKIDFASWRCIYWAYR